MLALVGAGLDADIYLEALREASQKADTDGQTYVHCRRGGSGQENKESRLSGAAEEATRHINAPMNVLIPQCGTVGVNSTVRRLGWFASKVI